MGPYELLQKIVIIMERLNIPYLITGSIASMAYGEPRLTNDIDVVAAMEERHIHSVLKAFPFGEFYISEEAFREAIRCHGQFNIIHPASGLKIDIMIKKKTPFDDSRFERIRRIHTSEHIQANFAAPEDVIVKKMEFYKAGASEKHLRDIMGILKISREEVDFHYITEWANHLQLTEIWDAVKERLLNE